MGDPPGEQRDSPANGPVEPQEGGRDSGPAGSRGEKGDRGAIGPAGPQGVAGENGSAGSQGERGNSGITGAVGPQGPQGEKGSDGQGGQNGQDSSNGNNPKNSEGQGQGVSNSNQDPDRRNPQRNQDRAEGSDGLSSVASVANSLNSRQIIALAKSAPLECPPSMTEVTDHDYVVVRLKELDFAPGKQVTLMALCSPMYSVGSKPEWKIEPPEAGKIPVKNGSNEIVLWTLDGQKCEGWAMTWLNNDESKRIKTEGSLSITCISNLEVE